MKLKNKIVALALVVASAFGLAVSNRATKVEAADETYTKVTDVSDLATGNSIVIVASNYNYALSTTQNNNNRGSTAITKSGDNVIISADTQIITLVEGKTSGSFAFNVGTAGYLYAASTGSNHLKTKTTLDNNGSWNITINNGVATVKSVGNTSRGWMRFNNDNNPKIFSCYGTGQTDISIYKLNESAPELPPLDNVTGLGYNSDTNTLTWNAVANAGKYEVVVEGKTYETATNSYTFSGLDFNAEYTAAVKAIPANTETHNPSETAAEYKFKYIPTMEEVTAAIEELDTMAQFGLVFDEEESGGQVETAVSISFADVANRTEFSTTKQVWEQNGITVTNNKGKSTSNVANYSNPARFYKSSELIVSSVAEFTKVVINCSDAGTPTIDENLGTVTTSGSTITVTLNEATTELAMTLSGGQVRAYSIDVYVMGEGKGYSNFRNATLRFVGIIPAELAGFVNQEAGAGIVLTVNGVSKPYAAEIVTEEDDSLRFAVRLLVPDTAYDVEVTGQAFVYLNGAEDAINLGDKSYSVESIVEHYLGDSAVSTADKAILTAFSGTFAA